MLSNTDVAELLAQRAERESSILARAFRRAARSAFLWPEEVAELVSQNRPLTELRAIGPYIERQIRRWLDRPPRVSGRTPAIRKDFISLTEARQVLSKKQGWAKNLRGDLQMHTRWSDGSGTIAEMADAATDSAFISAHTRSNRHKTNPHLTSDES